MSGNRRFDEVRLCAAGFSFIYGPTTQNGIVHNKMTPTSSDLPKDKNSKSIPKNNNTKTVTPEVIPISIDEDNFPAQ